MFLPIKNRIEANPQNEEILPNFALFIFGKEEDSPQNVRRGRRSITNLVGEK